VLGVGCRVGSPTGTQHLTPFTGAECVRDYIRSGNGNVVTGIFLVGPGLIFSVMPEPFGAECCRDYITCQRENVVTATLVGPCSLKVANAGVSTW
jgi:hypothetical protein